MKPTVTQLYQSATAILSAIVSRDKTGTMDNNIQTAIEYAMKLAEAIPETDILPEPDALRKFLAQVFAEVNGRAIAKSQLSMMLQDRLNMGRRNAEHTLMWAESNKLLNADVSGNGVRYTLA